MSERSNSSHRQILRSSSIIGGASVINILIGLLRIKVVAVLLGPAGVGLVGLLQNLMATASTVAALGFGTVGTRQIAEAAGREDQAGIDTARRALFWGTLCLAAVGGILLWALRHVLAVKVLADPGQAPLVGWLAVGVALTIASGAQGALLTGMRRVGDIARVQVYSAILSTVLGIGAIWLLGEAGLLLFILAGPFAGFVIGQLYVARLPKIQTPPAPLPALVGQWQTMARLGTAFMVAGLVGVLGQLAVRTLVQRELGAESLGYFQAAWVISMTYLGFVLGAMGTDYYPRLTAAIHDHATANRLANEQTEVALLLAGPVLLGMLALAPWVIQLLYTAEFAPAASILRWQILGDVLKIVSWPLGFIILAAGDGRTFMLSETAAMAVFAGITWLALPWLGIQTAGISFLLMYMVLLPLVYWLARRRTGFAWSRTVLRDVLLLSGAATLVAACGAWHDWLGAVVGVLAAGGFGIIALLRLARMAELGGALGRLATMARRYVFKLGVMHD
ncbi:O-antigen translocase [Pseudomonas sp. N040]|uniref:O-antigen translocase n=1 Tax=Pseudomonas sp. N040 TaxID=2785325 RepID=UPI0018A2D7C2|nr:O-antigen translocase [Pseudomonas sp. N040]MBF7730508.1 O-antigen translocase [Pseudomonas sp. N040]MBW7014152.1 O-antigen translocase [Pseudomonas sp. N040]